MKMGSMITRPANRLASVLLAFTLVGFVANADDGIEELARARETFEKEIAFSTRPIRDRYLSRLEAMKRSLGSRGDARAAAAVQDELDRVRASIPDPAMVKYAGNWKITFTNGETRRYIVTADGAVSYTEQSGKRLTPPRTGKLVIDGAEALLDFQDGAIHRIKMAGKTLVVELFNAKAGNPDGPIIAKGTGTMSPADRE
jgi:hypothetical protein